MEQQILIAECKGRTVAALWENGSIVELRYSPRDPEPAVGEIYIGKVQKVLPGISSAFIEIAPGRSCYYNLEDNPQPVFTQKSGKKELTAGDELLVQIKKEAGTVKQPIVTSKLCLTGEYVVITYGNTKKGISSKITGVARDRLHRFLDRIADSSASPIWKHCGIILRTGASDVPEELIQRELSQLTAEFENLLLDGKTRTCFSCLRKEPDAAFTMLRDISGSSLTTITAEDGVLYEIAQSYIKKFQPQDLPKLKKYTDPAYPMKKRFSLEHITDEALKEKVWLHSGAFLIIQKTEALTVIDVNSGKYTRKKGSFSEINREAASEAARQIRLRNLSGIIIVDFINMQEEKEKEDLLRFFQTQLNLASPPGQILGMTKLQLVEITRKKIRRPLAECLSESS